MRDVPRHRETVDGPVGGVIVEGQVGFPYRPQPLVPKPHLWGILPQVVPVQVDPGAVHPRAHAALWTELPAELRQVELAISGVDGVVAVGVEQRQHHEREVGEYVPVRSVQQVPHQAEAPLLPFHFPGVDAALDEDDRDAGASGGGGGGEAVRGEHEQRQVSAAGTDPDRSHMQPTVVLCRERGDERHDICVAGRLGVVRGLGAGGRRHGWASG